MEPMPETSDLAQRKPATGRLTREQKMGRSKTTNKPGYLAPLTPLRQTRRRRDLINLFIAALGGPDAVTDLTLVAVKRAAELTCASERARALILTSPSVLATDLEMLSRLEGAASRAVRALGIKDDAAKPSRVATRSPWSPLRARINAPLSDEAAK
jgi:hypothetical protein